MNVFVYGTLLVPKIWELVTECPHLTPLSATLHGHSIWRVEDATFPAIKKEDRDDKYSVAGQVYLEVPPLAMQRLDLYEDAFYERVEVTVLTDNGEIDAQVYRAPSETAKAILSDDPWTLEWFEKNGLEPFLKNVFDH